MAHWARGIGSTLLTDLLDEAGRHDCTEMFLEVRADNPRAQNLYRRFGFSDVGIRRGYYQPSGMDAIVMRCGLGLGAVPADGAVPPDSAVLADGARPGGGAVPGSAGPAGGAAPAAGAR
jgi:ribosomal-protein-alanine N-acetyltransferase